MGVCSSLELSDLLTLDLLSLYLLTLDLLALELGLRLSWRCSGGQLVVLSVSLTRAGALR